MWLRPDSPKTCVVEGSAALALRICPLLTINNWHLKFAINVQQTTRRPLTGHPSLWWGGGGESAYDKKKNK